MTTLVNAEISLQAHNPQMVVPVAHNQTFPDGYGQASSDPVQFNINKAATNGTIYVDGKNDGVVIATITSNHVLKDARFSFVPGGSMTDGNNAKPNDIHDSVRITSTIISNKEVKFLIHRVGPDVGNITLVFFVEYRAATNPG